jgi:hypothetical protein
MALWIKILIGLWLYLSLGLGVLLFSQIIAKRMEDSDNYDDYIWYTNLKIDPDDDEFGAVVIGVMMLWPILLIVLIFMLVEGSLKKIFRTIWKDKK